MDRFVSLLEALLSSPITWGVLTVVAIALALSGKLSINAATVLVWVAFGAAIFGVYRAEAVLKLDVLLGVLVLGCCGFGFATAAVLVNRWIREPVKIQETSPQADVAPAGFISFLGQVMDGSAAMLQENQTKAPLDDVPLSVTAVVPKVEEPTNDSEWGTGKIAWQKEMEIGTCRALLTTGSPERFVVPDEKRLMYYIVILTRFQTYRETIKLTKTTDREYSALHEFWVTGTQPSYSRTIKVGIVNRQPEVAEPMPKAQSSQKTQTKYIIPLSETLKTTDEVNVEKHSALKAQQEAEARLRSLQAGHTATQQFTIEILPANASLKARAYHLSDKIIKFVIERLDGAPAYPKGETWSQDVSTVHSYDAATLKMYNDKFGIELKQIHDELQQKQLTDRTLDDLYQHPGNTDGIRIVGERVGQLAEKLP